MPARVLSFLLIASVVAGCKKKVPEPVAELDNVQRVDLALQITSVTPRTIPANSPARAKVYGSGFETGAAVIIGEQAVGNVRVVDPNTIEIDIEPRVAGLYDVTVRNPTGESTTLTQGLNVAGEGGDCRFTRVYFDFDSASLRADSRTEIDGRVACYQDLGGRLRIAGHADERGTTDYNLALGQRRADSVRVHLSNQGILASRISTVSYGEEQPLERGSTESAWAKNRRAEVTAD